MKAKTNIIMTEPGTREFMQTRISSLTNEENYSFGMLFFLRRVAWYLDNTKCFPDQIVANDNGVEFIYKGTERELRCLFYNDKTIATHYSDDTEHINYGSGSAKEVAKAITRYVELL